MFCAFAFFLLMCGNPQVDSSADPSSSSSSFPDDRNFTGGPSTAVFRTTTTSTATTIPEDLPVPLATDMFYRALADFMFESFADPSSSSSSFPDDRNFTGGSSTAVFRTTTTSTAMTIPENLPVPWAADMFYRALADFTVSEDAAALSSTCQKHTQMYVRHLKNNSYWAVKMYDSWSRYPIGVLAGNTHQMGVYDECVDVHRPVQGKYCMAAVRLGAVRGTVFKLNNRDEQDSADNAWNEILGFVDYQDRYRRDEVKFGVCIPESCTAEDLEASLQKRLDDAFLPHRVQARVRVQPTLCSADKDVRPPDAGYYATVTIMSSVLLVCCASTVYHLIVMTRNEGVAQEKSVPDFVRWFSIVYNGRKLVKYDRNNDLNVFNGIKCLTMVLILYGHKFLYHSMHPTLYAMRLENIYRIGPETLLTCMNLVDPFFFINGYLMYALIKPKLAKRGVSWTRIPKILVYKYLRMIPAYGTIILLTAHYIPHLYRGPFWAYRMWPEAERCKNYWWANLLGVSNFVDAEHECLIAGWYISCILQFLVIGTVNIYICAKNRKVGVGLMCVLLCVSLGVPFVSTYVNRSYGMVRVMMPFLDDPNNSFEFRYLYKPFYIRAIPFYAGLLAAVAVEELNKKKIKMSKITIFVWTFVITTICIFVQYHGARFYDRHRPYNVVEQASYATISHCTWTSILFWMTICHFTSGYGPIDRVFDNRFAAIFGRLSYSVYLVNIPVMMTIEFKQSTSVAPDTDLWLDSSIVGVVRSYAAGLVLYLAVEAPFSMIVKSVFVGSEKVDNDERAEKCRVCDSPNDGWRRDDSACRSDVSRENVVDAPK